MIKQLWFPTFHGNILWFVCQKMNLTSVHHVWFMSGNSRDMWQLIHLDVVGNTPIICVGILIMLCKIEIQPTIQELNMITWFKLWFPFATCDTFSSSIVSHSFFFFSISVQKQHPKEKGIMEFSKSDLMKLLGLLEAELQARDLVINSLKVSHTQQESIESSPWVLQNREIHYE